MLYPLKIQQAIQALKRGGVIAYPTEAVWGLGCDPHNERAVDRLLAIKQRPISKGLILVAATLEQFAPYLTGLSAEKIKYLDDHWPGPITYIVPHNGYASKQIIGNHKTIALRVSAHKQVAQLCQCFGGPLVSTSANKTGSVAAKWPWQVRRSLAKQLDFQLTGQLGDSKRPTEIRNLVSGQILRLS